MHNKQWLLDNRPAAEAQTSNFKLVTTDTPALQDGQVFKRCIERHICLFALY